MVVSMIRMIVASCSPCLGVSGSAGGEEEEGGLRFSCGRSAGGLGCSYVGVTLEEATG